jgi:tetratricopeptide (TPR) repeat protein
MRRAILPAIVLLLSANAAHSQCTPAAQRLVDERKSDEAKAHVVAQLARTPQDDQALDCLGRIELSLDRPREAVGHLEKAVKINDRSASHHLWLGNALGSMADSTSKLKLPFLARRIKSEFERAVALDPKSIEARNGLIQFYREAPGVMGGSMDKAREQVREIAKLNPMRGHFAAADLLAFEKKPAEAERELIAAEKESPDSAVAAYGLGNFYQNQKRWADAFATYDRMLKQFPNEMNVHFQIGRTAALSGEQLERGEKELRVWIGAPPKDAALITRAGAHHRLGMIYEHQGRKDLARSEYQQALAIDPRSVNAKKSLAALK